MDIKRLTLLWIVLVCSLAGCKSQPPSAPDGWKPHPLGKGQVSVFAPADYQAANEANNVLVLTPPGDIGVTLRLKLDYMEGDTVAANAGELAVEEHAGKSQLPVTKKAGKVFFMESLSDMENNKQVELRFWRVGFQNAVVLMYATIPDEKKSSPAVQELFGNVVPTLIETMKKN